ncbi:hypothetical protein EVAR_25929_1 [Eumeta japonica]|uniref:Uncharacterized protein n=1 Tax=Eumeta variegata TaxID=151549 RepID=A0A4C1W2F3_EUMVA|nr:hypothetical protein EVAR_25929_1 [Eumeta japonica]
MRSCRIGHKIKRFNKANAKGGCRPAHPAQLEVEAAKLDCCRCLLFSSPQRHILFQLIYFSSRGRFFQIHISIIIFLSRCISSPTLPLTPRLFLHLRDPPVGAASFCCEVAPTSESHCENFAADYVVIFFLSHSTELLSQTWLCI